MLPDRIFVHANTEFVINDTSSPSHSIITLKEMAIDHPVYEQDEMSLTPWIDPHGLKKVQGTWYKDGQHVVTGGLHYK